MRFFISIIAIFVIILLVSNLNAAKVYTWTDKKGNLHISEEPPPGNAKVKDVIDYKPKADKEAEASGTPPEEGHDGPLIKRRQQEARSAREQAKEAAREAQAAQTKANQAVKKANEYINTHNRNQYMRRVHKYEMRKVAEDAKKAQEQARVATEKAHTAEKRAQAVEEQAQKAAVLPTD